MADILVLAPRFPYPIEAGDTLRIHHLSEQLAREHSLTLLSLCRSPDVPRRATGDDVFDRFECVHHPPWRAWLQTAGAFLTGDSLQLGYFRSSQFERRVDELVPEHDLVLAHLTRTGQYVAEREDVPTVLEMTDALSLNYERVSELRRWNPQDLLYRIEASRAYTYERRILHEFDLVSLVSAVDRDFLLEDRQGMDHVRVYTNGIDLEERLYRPPGAEPTMAFIGNMRTVHNRASCEYFLDEVFPYVREEIPGAEFRIIGAAPSSVQQALERRDGVTVTGWVDHIPEATSGAFCGIGVMQAGCGLQNKVLEYMALGLPVVTNSIGIEGINLDAGTEARVAETPREIASHVVDLYRNEQERNALARRARSFVEEHHSWRTALQPFVDDVNALLRRRDDQAQSEASPSTDAQS